MSTQNQNDYASTFTDDQLAEEYARLDFVVGVGASAGGLQSLEKLLSGLTICTNAAFVIAQHISPDIVSSMAEILSRSTNLTILNIQDGMEVQPGTVYLVPPGKEVRLDGSEFVTEDMDREQVLRVIDNLFFSIAESFGRQTIGVILSGSGSDGSNGISAIHDAGGFVLAESPETAQFDGMPRNAIQTNRVDGILAIDKIPGWLNRQFQNPDVRPDLSDDLPPEQLSGINLLFSLLKRRHDVDFEQYKPSTVARRIDRRLQITHSSSILAYADFAKDNVEELDFLYHDLLIGVTKFFRDTDAFLSLEQCLYELIEQLPDNEPLRIWSAGCATGEEAYSLAMLCHDCFVRLSKKPNFKVFATDIHKGSLDVASQGLFPNESVEFATQERRERYFVQEDREHVKVNSLLRSRLVFARHNVFKDPPFTRMHLVTCRNLLIYLKRPAQLRAISSFHFSLVQDGILMLGSSETPGDLVEEFRVIQPSAKIFQKIRNLPNLVRSQIPEIHPSVTAPRRLVNILNSDRPESLSFTKLLNCYDLVLGEYVDSGLLLDESRNILHVFGDANRYLVSKTGRFSGNFSDFLNGRAKVDITSGMIRSSKSPDKKIVLQDVEFGVGGTTEVIDVHIRALSGDYFNQCIWFVEFVTRPEGRPEVEEVEFQSGGADISQLESELYYTQDSLNATIEELEASNEELQASNEELIASNEELQSTNEELQSVNEELYTVNLENNRRIDEFHELTEDLEILLNTTTMALLFLDKQLQIRRFTESIHKYFNLIERDVGRDIRDFTNKTGCDDIYQLLQKVIETNEPLIENSTNPEGEKIVLKLIPHRAENHVAGVVLAVEGADSEDLNLDFLEK